MSLPVVLFLIFLVLKLIGVITWSWLWVTAPLWIGLAITAVLFGGLIALAFFAETTKFTVRRRKR